MFPVTEEDYHRIQQRAEIYRSKFPEFESWAKGYGVISHSDTTQVRIYDLCQQLICQNRFGSIKDILDILKAADRLANAAMWLVVHMTYANKVDLKGNPLDAQDFKSDPQGHTGGSLNMVPGYVGYMTANAIAGITRSWIMGQGHCAAAIESVNVMLRNLHPEQAGRYPFNDEGLSQLAEDFYSYAINKQGEPGVPLGSHVNPYTAGSLIEGGYLGFAELQYVHMPLPGERLVSFLSDGAFEEQRGSDWASRWWRAEDCGLVTPVMIANGRRIDQRSTMYQQGGLEWFYQHLQHNGFYPLAIDGRDPAEFVWGIFECESRLTACRHELEQQQMCYPVKLPYLIAETEKGFGFYGAGTNAAHGTPLPSGPKNDKHSRDLFNRYTQRLFVPNQELKEAISQLRTHAIDNRKQEKEHPLAHRNVSLKSLTVPKWVEVNDEVSPMEALDTQFCEIIDANPHLRVRLGNPDELRSNRLGKSLDKLKHRVLSVENGVAESITGSVITALNEEAVVSAALANKGGLNLVASYEAFAVKMLGALRQEIIFARHQKEIGRPAKWLSVPIIATSHLWENGKNEQSHQDPTFGEALLAEMNDVSRVVYPADANTTMASLDACFQTQGEIWTLTIPKQNVLSRFSPQQSIKLLQDGAINLDGLQDIELVAVGAYQLNVCIALQSRLREIGIECSVIYLLEPGRFRLPRDMHEKAFVVPKNKREQIFSVRCKLRVFICHMHPEVILGVCRPLDLGMDQTLAFGYQNKGGTFNTDGLLKANGCDVEKILEAIIIAEKRNGKCQALEDE